MTRALVLSGGGANGGFQAGALLALEGSGYHPDVVAGVSAGALSAVGYVLHGPRWLVTRWKTLRTEDVTTEDGRARMAWRVARGRLGVQKAHGLRRTVENAVDKAIPEDGPIVLIGMVDYETGEYETVRANGLPRELLVDAVMASASIPGQWPPACYLGRKKLDGGIRRMIPLADVLPHRPDEVTTVATEPERLPHRPPPRSVVDVGAAALDTMLSQIARKNLAAFLRINELVQASGGSVSRPDGGLYHYYRHRLIRPDSPLGSSLDFNHPPQEERIRRGYTAARSILGLAA